MPISSPSWNDPGVLCPVLESVLFSDDPIHFNAPTQEGTFESAPAPLPSDLDARFINTSCQTNPVEMEAGNIPACPLSFAQMISVPLPPSSIPLLPLCHH
jgi:hypothetical protein